MYRGILHLILALLLLQFFTACSTFKNTHSLNNTHIGQGVDSYEASFQGRKVELPVRVAILPFENMTSNDKAGRLVRNSFYSQFASKNIGMSSCLKLMKFLMRMVCMKTINTTLQKFRNLASC